MPRQFVYNKPALKPRRQQLRNQLTEAEKVLWIHLKHKKLGFWFKRQVSIYSYVVDFYCPQKRLVIELDGQIHKSPSQIKYDTFRDKYLKALNIKVLRFWNQEVITDPSRVIEKIKTILNTPTLHSPKNTPPF